MDDRKHIVKWIKRLVLFSILGPAAGLALEIVLADLYGASSLIDAYRVGGLYLNFGRKLFMGEALVAFIVPLFSEFKSSGEEREGFKFISAWIMLLSLLLAPLLVCAAIFPGSIQALLAPGLQENSAQQARFFIRILALPFFLLPLNGILSSLLQCYRIFSAKHILQIFLNCSVVVCVLLWGADYGKTAIAAGFVAGSVLGTIFCLALLFGKTRPNRIRPGFRLSGYSLSGAGRTGLILVPLVCMVFAQQWHSVLLSHFLSYYDPGTLSNYGYARRLVQLGGLVPVAMATVMFPSLSEIGAQGDKEEFRSTATKSLRGIFFLGVFGALFCFCFREQISNLVFFHGKMTAQAMEEIGGLFGILLLAVPCGAVYHLFVRISYSMKNTYAPLARQVVIGALLTLILMYSAGYLSPGAVLACFVGLKWITLLAFGFYLDLKYKCFHIKNVLGIVWKCAAVACVLYALLTVYGYFYNAMIPNATKASHALSLVPGLVIFVAAGWVLCSALRVREADIIAGIGSRYIRESAGAVYRLLRGTA